MNKKQDIQNKYLELQAIEQQIKQAQQQILMLNQQILELMKLAESIEDFKKIKENSKTFVPLGSGIYVEAEIKNTKRLLINVGTNVSIFRTPEESKDMINKQIEDIKEITKKTENDLYQIITYATKLQEEIRNLME